MNEIFTDHLKQKLSSYKYRESQLRMAHFILERLKNRENGIIEAGTGTGKSMAYLFPSVLYSIAEGKRVAISTETKALQKQLLDNDLPIVQDICRENLKRDFKFSLCLGSRNYPCRRRFEGAVKKGILKDSDRNLTMKMQLFFSSPDVFTFFDINAPFDFWEEVNRDPDACAHQKCPFFKQCHFQTAKKEWATSDLLIMNHYLFFSNIASDKAYLPVTEAVVFDEAHSVETIASNQLGFSIDLKLLGNIINRFYSKKGKSGVVFSFKNTISQQESINLIDKIMKEGQIFFEKLRDLFSERETVLRITRKLDFGQKFLGHLEKFIEVITLAEGDFEEEDTLLEFEPAKNKITAYTQSLKFFLELDRDSHVYWIERDGQELLGNVQAIARPVNIDEIMRDEVFSFYESTIFTSATLSVKGEFSYFISRMGFLRGKAMALPSPFDYRRQMVLYTEKNLPEPTESMFPERIALVIAEIVKIVGGNCLVLFTSYKMLKMVKHVLQRTIPNRIFSQDELSASGALSAYIGNKGAVLMGTHSFWQGIDLPGDLLKGVVITRLPFSVPDTPIMKARMEKIEQKGKNSFFELQIPEAVIKMKQGAGRLIRNEEDRGIVAVLDPRIISKGYGSAFLDSLPNGERVMELKGLPSSRGCPASTGTSLEFLKIRLTSFDLIPTINLFKFF